MPAGVSAPTMLWISALLLGVGSAGVIVITKIMLGFLLALGPVFIMCGLFGGTRGLFEGWLRSVVGGAFVLAFTLLATAGALAVFAPMTEEIARNQRLGDNSVGAVFALTIASVVFAMLIRQVVASTTQIVSAWRLPDRIGLARPEPTLAGDVSGAHAATPTDTRIIDMVASVSHAGEGTGAAPSRASTISPVAASAASDAGGETNVVEIRRASRAYRGFGSAGVRTARGRP
jgi:type IV secretion system protein VirB6